jgi:ABC-type sugar transport system substrate-binding protein
MKTLTRTALLGAALLGAAGLVTSTLPTQAAGSGTIAESPAVKQSPYQQLAQRPYDPSAGSVGFKKSKKKKAKK